MKQKFEVGDSVELSKAGKARYPKTQFTTGIVRKVERGSVSVKRDFYSGHEFTWWDVDDWSKIGERITTGKMSLWRKI